MLRAILTYLLPFLLPAIVFFIWVWFRARYAERHGGTPPKVEQGHYFWLTLAGGVLVLMTLGATALLSEGGRPGDTYMPPRVIDGKVVPGEHQR